MDRDMDMVPILQVRAGDRIFVTNGLGRHVRRVVQHEVINSGTRVRLVLDDNYGPRYYEPEDSLYVYTVAV